MFTTRLKFHAKIGVTLTTEYLGVFGLRFLTANMASRAAMPFAIAIANFAINLCASAPLRYVLLITRYSSLITKMQPQLLQQPKYTVIFY